MDVHNVLFQIGLTCLVLFLGGLLARKIHLSLIPLYILIGLFLGRFVQHTVIQEFMSTMGLLLLLFMIGLEFSLGTFLRNKEKFLKGGVYDLALNLPLGLVVGFAFGLDLITSLFLSGIIYVSSSAIICKGIIEFKRAANPETECLLGILVFEDIFIALYLAVLSSIVTMERLELLPLGLAVLKALGFCIALIGIGRAFKRYLDILLDIESTELFVLLIFAIVILTSHGARTLGLSEAIGAFFAGMVVSETGQKNRTLELIAPFQYLTVAIFFVSFGMMTDYSAFGEVLPFAFILVGVSIPFKVITGLLAGRGYGLSRRACLRLGLSLLPRGEFSVVLAVVATGLAGGHPHHLQSLTTLYVLILAVVGSIIMMQADFLSRWAEEKRTS